MANPKVTNILLGIIAVLLLILVIQNFSNRPFHDPFGFHAGMTGASPHRTGSMPSSGMGMSRGEVTDPEEMKHVHSASMVIGSLSCPTDASLTLVDPSCAGKEPDDRRYLVETSLAKSLPISKVFDLVVAKYGENALTESALRIWKGRQTGTQ